MRTSTMFVDVVHVIYKGYICCCGIKDLGRICRNMYYEGPNNISDVFGLYRSMI